MELKPSPIAALLSSGDPVRFARERLGFTPDANQARVLTVDAQRVILGCHRQFGKSTATAVKALHHAFHQPESLTIVVAPTLRQGGLLLDTIHRFAHRLGLELKPDKYNRPALVLPNRSRLIAVPSEEHNIRGFSAVSLLLIDEAARVPDEVWSAILPTVATVNGAIWLMSTPMGKQGFFAGMWHNGDPNWNRIRVTADQSTRIAKSVIDEQRRSLSHRQFAQDYLCEFGDTEDQVFRTGIIERAFKPDIEPIRITRGWRHDVWHRNAIEFGYYVGIDLAKSPDYTAIVVIELHTWENGWINVANYERLTDTTLRVRHIERMSDKPYTEVLNRLTEIVELLGQRTVVVADATGLGAPFIDFLRASTLRLRNDAPNRPPREIPANANQYQQHGYLLPVTITASGTAGSTPKGGYNVPKVDLIETLDRMFEAGRPEIAANLPEAEALKSELLGLRRNGTRYEPHSSLGHDDLVMALALAAWRPAGTVRICCKPPPTSSGGPHDPPRPKPRRSLRPISHCSPRTKPHHSPRRTDRRDRNRNRYQSTRSLPSRDRKRSVAHQSRPRVHNSDQLPPRGPFRDNSRLPWPINKTESAAATPRPQPLWDWPPPRKPLLNRSAIRPSVPAIR